MISKEEKNDLIDKMKDIKFHNNNQHTKKIMGLLGINNNNINNFNIPFNNNGAYGGF